MPLALSHLCRNLQHDTEKLEEELKQNIVDCHKLLIDKKATGTKLALEKAKDYHYKEVLDILKDIVISIRKIIYHEEKLRKLEDENNVSQDELKRYSYVQRQVQAFSNAEEVVTKREKRRVASDISVGSLEAWNLYLEKKEEEEKAIQVEQITIPKRKTKSNRRKKKFVSSTFNNFLDNKGRGILDSILEDEQTVLNEKLAELGRESDCDSCSFESIISEKSDQCDMGLEEVPATSLSSICESESGDENFKEKVSEGDTKPKIVDVIYKKKN